MGSTLTGPPVVLLGASSQVGVFLVPRLLATGRSVIAVSRRGRPQAFPEFPDVRWIAPAAVAKQAGAARDLVSAGPLALALAVLDDLPELRRVVALSSTSVRAKADSPDRRERRMMAAMDREERNLEAACSKRSARLCLLRPTLVYGAGLDRNVTRLAHWAKRWGVVPVAGRAAGRRQPIHADDVALAAVEALDARHDLPRVLDLAGGSTLTYRAMAERVAEGSRPGARVWGIPVAVLAAAAAILSLAPGRHRISPAMVYRQASDLVFDDELARRLLGHAPRPFRPGPRDFAFPGPDRLLALSRGTFVIGEYGNDGKI